MGKNDVICVPDRSLRCGCCGVFSHITCVDDTSDLFICSTCLRDDPTAIPFFKNEEDLSVYTDFKTIETPHDLLQQHSTFTCFEGKSGPNYSFAAASCRAGN